MKTRHTPPPGQPIDDLVVALTQWVDAAHTLAHNPARGLEVLEEAQSQLPAPTAAPPRVIFARPSLLRRLRLRLTVARPPRPLESP